MMLFNIFFAYVGFNKVMEANVDAMDDDSGGGGGLVEKPSSTSSMEERKAYIQAKYIDRRYVAQCYANRTEVYMALEQAVEGHSLADLLQAFGEAAAHGVDLTDPLPHSDIGETLLHRYVNVCQLFFSQCELLSNHANVFYFSERFQRCLGRTPTAVSGFT